MNKLIEYKNLAGEERTFEKNGRRRAKPMQRTEKKFICPKCGHEVCLRCLRLTWEAKLDGETIKCCQCPNENSVRFLEKTVALPQVSDEQAQAIFDWEK